MTRVWQLVRSADELLEYSKIAGNALFAIKILRLQRHGILSKDDLEADTDKSLVKARGLFQDIIEDMTHLESGNIKHVMLLKLLGTELSLSDVKALKNKLSEAQKELDQFMQEKKDEPEEAEEILEIIENASRRGVLESITSLTLLPESPR